MTRLTLALLITVAASAACGRDEKSGPAKGTTTGGPAPSAAPSAARSAAPEAPLPVPDQIVCQQVLVAYKGASKAPRGLSRTKDEARARVSVVAGLAKDSPDDFDDLVKKYSDDPSAERLGSTGLVKRGDLVKPFADAAFSLQIGQVVGPIETPFGFHVIKRTQ